MTRDPIEQLTQRWQREREARKTAERVLEEKSRELFAINQELLELATENIAKEEWSRSILEAAAEGIITTDEEAGILTMNRAAKQMFGFSGGRIANLSLDHLVPQGIAGQPLTRLLRDDSVPGEVRTLDCTGRKATGEQFPLEISLSCATPGDRSTHIVIFRDVSERKLAEKKLEASRRRFQMILETVMEGILGLDKDGRFVFLNTAASNMLGWRAEELIGRPSHELIHHTHADGTPHPAEECPIYRLLHHNQELSMIEDVFWRKDGTSFPVEYFSRPMRQDGETSGVVISFLNIADRKLQEEEKKKIEIQLRQAQKLESIGQLAAGIAHEINTPTQYVSDNTRFLHDGFTDLWQYIDAQEQAITRLATTSDGHSRITDEIRQLAEQIDIAFLREEIPLAIEQSLEGLERITKIVRAMKEFSHPGVEEKTVIDINKALDSTIDVSRNEWKYHAEIERRFQEPLPNLRCLPGEINQAFLNIIVNSAQAIKEAIKQSGEEKGLITITTRADGDYIEIDISDTGTGIPEHVLPRIFDPFFTTKGVGKGTGQGLAISYSAIVDKHGGSIQARNNPDRGATFIIRLPIDLE